ncbi:preprotein translocase subunit SecD [Devosia sp. UYZn731]|uniref:SecDF P1 head subdomain-containing protein n=1 Tax=Devosia sp. UYZn731 TaxID=3156345 RepID=UPI00339B3D5A
MVMKMVVVVALALLVGAGNALAAPIVLAIKDASVGTDIFGGQPTVVVELEADAQRTFAKLTARHVGETLDLLIDGTVVSSPVIQTVIPGPSVVISGDFTASEVVALARRISSGQAVVSVELASE